MNTAVRAAVRLGLPATRSLPPFTDWPQRLRGAVEGATFLDDGIGGLGAAYEGGVRLVQLVHYVRNVANELGRDGITANYINADAVDTPMFREVLQEDLDPRPPLIAPLRGRVLPGQVAEILPEVDAEVPLGRRREQNVVYGELHRDGERLPAGFAKEDGPSVGAGPGVSRNSHGEPQRAVLTGG